MAMVRFGRWFAWVGLALLVTSVPAVSQTKLHIGYAPGPDWTAAYIAKEYKLFEKHGLDVEMTLMPSVPAITAGLLSNSIDIGTLGIMSIVLSQDAGLPVTIVSAAMVVPTGVRVGMVGRQNSGIKTAKDLAGKTVAVIALRSNLDIMINSWLVDNGVDLNSVKYIEASQTQMPELLKSGQVDAAILSDPAYQRALSQASAYPLRDIWDGAPDGVPATAYLSSKEWAASHADTIARFRDALREASAIAKSDDMAVRKAIAKYNKLSEDIVATIPIPNLGVDLNPTGLDWLLGVLVKEKLLTNKPDRTAIVTP